MQRTWQPLGRGVEHRFFGASASCSNHLAEEEIYSSPARAGPIDNIESLGPVGGRVSVIASLPERLPGLVEGSLRPQFSFEYSVPGSYLVVTKPPRGLRKSWSTLVYG